MKVLIFGDVVGRIGRAALKEIIPSLKKKYQTDFVIANAENLAHGTGVTKATFEEIRQAGVDFCTSGNHIWDKVEVHELFAANAPLLRPANYPPGVPGKGAMLVKVGTEKLLIANVMGRVFMGQDFDDPFRAVDAILEEYKDVPRAGTIIDIHAEATSEKVAFGLYFDGRVSAIFGTHTHVPTSDMEILPGGEAYVTDVGMVGAKGSVIGVDKKNILKKFLTQMPAGHEMIDSGRCVVNAVLVTIDSASGKATAIERIREEVEVI